MDPSHIVRLLQPFLAETLSGSDSGPRSIEAAALTPAQLDHISTYLDLLVRWNARINLTAVRDADEIVTRHFGESIFAARFLFSTTTSESVSLVDIGSGAGFPGLPMKIWNPSAGLTLIESNHKKVAFLREVVRALRLSHVTVFAGRAEDYSGSAELVTLRAVEQFQNILPLAARLVRASGRLALLIGAGQVRSAHDFVPDFIWNPPVPIPLSSSRVLLIGTRNDKNRDK
jgi:16S rRNA (guanine527-N7)-methyltransferase